MPRIPNNLHSIHSCTISQSYQPAGVQLSDFDVHYHELVFSLRCHERTGPAFQLYFEEIMVRHDSEMPRISGPILFS